MKISATALAVIVSFQLAGVAYGVSAQTAPDSGDNKPFEQVTVQPGESFDVPAGAVVISVKELGLGEAPGATGNADASGA